MNITDKIYIAGSNGMVGSAVVRKLQAEGFTNLITKSSKELNLTNQLEVANFFETEQPEYVFMAAAKVGGILANNTFRAQFLYENLMIQNNVIHQSYVNNVKKLMFFGSSCIYPKLAPQPLKEEYLLTSVLEETNEPYAIAKIAGIKMCESYRKEYGCNFVSVMPTNLYGYNDNFDLTNSHVMPALIRKFFEAKEGNKKEIEIWGTGSPKREFLFVDDLADAILTIDKKYNDSTPINVGFGKDISIKEISYKMKKLFKFKGKIKFNNKFPDGTPRKLLNINKIKKLGWKPKTTLEKGILKTMNWYKKEYKNGIKK